MVIISSNISSIVSFLPPFLPSFLPSSLPSFLSFSYFFLFRFPFVIPIMTCNTFVLELLPGPWCTFINYVFRRNKGWAESHDFQEEKQLPLLFHISKFKCCLWFYNGMYNHTTEKCQKGLLAKTDTSQMRHLFKKAQNSFSLNPSSCLISGKLKEKYIFINCSRPLVVLL